MKPETRRRMDEAVTLVRGGMSISKAAAKAGCGRDRLETYCAALRVESRHRGGCAPRDVKRLQAGSLVTISARDLGNPGDTIRVTRKPGRIILTKEPTETTA